MKLPLPYKKDNVFNFLLLASFLGHAVFLGSGSFFVSSPRFAVRQAPSSLEVVILKETRSPREEVPSVRILSVKEPFTRAPEVVQKKKEERPRREIQKPIVSSPQKGVLEESTSLYLKNPAPLYPLLARENGWQGFAVLRVLVNPKGEASRVEVFKSSGYKILDQSAVRTVEKWRFLPARAGQWSFSSWVKIPIRFVLLDGD